MGWPLSSRAHGAGRPRPAGGRGRRGPPRRSSRAGRRAHPVPTGRSRPVRRRRYRRGRCRSRPGCGRGAPRRWQARPCRRLREPRSRVPGVSPPSPSRHGCAGSCRRSGRVPQWRADRACKTDTRGTGGKTHEGRRRRRVTVQGTGAQGGEQRRRCRSGCGESRAGPRDAGDRGSFSGKSSGAAMRAISSRRAHMA